MSRKKNWKTCIPLVLKDYCENTTLHGYKYLVQPNRPTIEKCIWFAIILTTFLMTLYIFLLLLDDYNNKATITTLENTKYHISNIPFPGVAICDVNRISRKQVLKLTAEMSQKIIISEEDLFYLLKSVGKLYDFEVDTFLEMQKLQNIVERYNIEMHNNNYDSLVKLLQQLSPNCSETLVKCKWMDEIIDCSQIFRTRRTMDGYCCTFNYVKSWKTLNLSYSDHFKEKYAKYGNDEKELYFDGAGLNGGLTVIAYSDPDDYYYPLTSSEGFSVKIFNPHDYPDVNSGGLIETYAALKREVFMQISARTIKPLSSLKTISVKKRGCLFENEGTTVFDSAFYSYSDCLADCKIKSILALCECVPFFIPVLKSYIFSKQVCTMTDIPCLNKYKEKWMSIYPYINIPELESERENSLRCPNCLPSCFSTVYSVEINYGVLVSLPFKSMKTLDLNKHSIIHIYSDTSDTSLYESDINYYWFDIISSFGGTCSLFVGFSLISVVEFFYFITVKYYRLLQNTNNEI